MQVSKVCYTALLCCFSHTYAMIKQDLLHLQTCQVAAVHCCPAANIKSTSTLAMARLTYRTWGE